MADNYFKLLGLSLDPPESNEGVIKKSIELKKNEWNNLLLQSSNSHKYEILIKSIPEIQKVMLDSKTRNEHANQIQKELYKKLDIAIGNSSLKGFVESKEIKIFSQKFGFSDEIIKKRISVEIKDNHSTDKIKQKPLPDSTNIRKIEDHLKNLNSEISGNSLINLYDFFLIFDA